MSFDAGMLAAVIAEINAGAAGGRIEKVYQPQNDEVVLLMRTRDGGRRLLLRCGANDPRICFTGVARDNPAAPPTLCMLLRKHLGGAFLVGVKQLGFERVASLEFDARDELGFPCKKYLIAEVMGKNSNLIFTDGDMKILAALRTVDFTTSRLRQVLVGMKYELPPPQADKRDPRDESADGFAQAVNAASGETTAAKFINSTYLGIAPVVAREIVTRACGRADASLCDVDISALYKAFSGVYADLNSGNTLPVIAYDGSKPVEYSFLPLTQYGVENCRVCESFGEMLDIYFGERDRAALVSARAADLQRAVASAQSRLQRKLEAQRAELADCDKGDECRRDADLIIANLYQLKRGDENVRLTDYSEMLPDGSFALRSLTLDPRLTPSANAQRLYKKYNKSCTARVELAKQIKLAERELEYIMSVKDALNRAESGAGLAQIRAELESVGVLRARKGAAPAKSEKAPLGEYVTTNGYEVLCGKNNLQNEEITFRRAEKGDIWFHAKGVPGSHVLLRTGGAPLDDIPDEDLNDALCIAAYNSDAREGNNVAVDYVDVRHVKKPPSARPGLVIYHTNYTAYITPDAQKVASMKK